MWLAPGREQASPCPRTLGSSGSKGSPLHLPVHSPLEYPVCCHGVGWGWRVRGRPNCTLPAAPAQQSHACLQPVPGALSLQSGRHLCSTGRNRVNSPWLHQRCEEGAPQNRTPPTLPPPTMLISREPRESE